MPIPGRDEERRKTVHAAMATLLVSSLKDAIGHRGSSAFSRAFPLYKDNPVP